MAPIISIDHLRINGLYIVVSIPRGPATRDEYDWALYLHTDAGGGVRYRIKRGDSGWVPDHGPCFDIFASHRVLGLFWIAQVPESCEVFVNDRLQSGDDSLNDYYITSRMWLITVLYMIQYPLYSERILMCDNLFTLEEEVTRWASQHYTTGAFDNLGPALGVSRICGLEV